MANQYTSHCIGPRTQVSDVSCSQWSAKSRAIIVSRSSYHDEFNATARILCGTEIAALVREDVPTTCFNFATDAALFR
jgi:hypothetical protein